MVAFDNTAMHPLSPASVTVHQRAHRPFGSHRKTLPVSPLVSANQNCLGPNKGLQRAIAAKSCDVDDLHINGGIDTWGRALHGPGQKDTGKGIDRIFIHPAAVPDGATVNNRRHRQPSIGQLPVPIDAPGCPYWARP